MADIRVIDLPSEENPALDTDFIAIDGSSTRKTKLRTFADKARPYASQAEAEAGEVNNKSMTPLRTAQAVAAQTAGLEGRVDALEGSFDTLVSDQEINFSGANAPDNAPPDTAPGYMKRNGLLLSSMVDDLATTPDPWPQIKTLLENASPERGMLLAGAPLIWDNKYGPWPLLSRTVGYIKMPQRLHMIMGQGASLNMTGLPDTPFAPTFFTYIGSWGNPSRLATGVDHLKGTDKLTLPAGQIAALGLKLRDDLHLRATEGLTDLAIGLWTGEDSVDALLPGTFSFYTAGATYAVGDGVIVRDQVGDLSIWNGFSMRCTVAHTAGAAITIGSWTPTGLNAKTQRLTIAGLETGGANDIVRLTNKLRYNFPATCKPVICKYEQVGHHIVEGFNVEGSDRGLKPRQAWATGQNYFDGEFVEGPDNRSYEVTVDHTSGVFATDVSAGRLVILPSDRLFLVERSDTFHILGGGIKGFLDTAIQAYSIRDFMMKDHHGQASENRKQPGGYLSFGGECNKALIDNCSIKGGSQPFMMSGRYYGVAYGVTWRDCLALGGDDGHTQHHMHDGTRYIRCGHEGSFFVQAGAMTSFDVRTPSELIDCWSKNHAGTAVMIRNQAFGRNTPEHYGCGTTIQNFKTENVLAGIQLDNAAPESATSHPGEHGILVIRGGELKRVGGTGSSGGIYMNYPLAPRPNLPTVYMDGVYIQLSDVGRGVEVAGKFRPITKDVTVDVSPDYAATLAARVPAVATLTQRSFYFHSEGGVDGDGPRNGLFDGCKIHSLLLPPSFSFHMSGDVNMKPENYSYIDAARNPGFITPFVFDVPRVPGLVTGITAETILGQVTIPQNMMGPNGWIEYDVTIAVTNPGAITALGKTTRVRFNGIAGTIYSNIATTTAASLRLCGVIKNDGADNVQIGANASNLSNSFGSSSTAIPTGARGTSADTDLVITGQIAAGGETDTIHLERATVKVYYAP